MHKKFEVNKTKIKGGCRSGRKVVPHNSKGDLPLDRLPGYNMMLSNANYSSSIAHPLCFCGAT